MSERRFVPFPACFVPSDALVGKTVRFRESYSTGVLVDGGPTAPAGFEATIVEVGDRLLGGGEFPILVRLPYDGGTVPQYVPSSVVELDVSEVRA